MLHTFTALPTSLDGDAITYTLGDPSSDPKTTAHSLTILTYLTPSDDTHPCLLNDRVDKGYKCVQDDRLQSTLGKQEGSSTKSPSSSQEASAHRLQIAVRMKTTQPTHSHTGRSVHWRVLDLSTSSTAMQTVRQRNTCADRM